MEKPTDGSSTPKRQQSEEDTFGDDNCNAGAGEEDSSLPGSVWEGEALLAELEEMHAEDSGSQGVQPNSYENSEEGVASPSRQHEDVHTGRDNPNGGLLPESSGDALLEELREGSPSSESISVAQL